MMRVGSQWVREQVYAGVVAAGYDDLNPAHVFVFQFPTPEGLRPSELADTLHAQGAAVSMAVSAKTTSTTTGRSGFYDYPALARLADRWVLAGEFPPDDRRPHPGHNGSGRGPRHGRPAEPFL